MNIARLAAPLLIAAFTLGCSPDLEYGATPTGPSTDSPTNPSDPPALTVPFLDRTSESGFGGLRFGPPLPNSMAGVIIGGVAAGDVDDDGDIDLFVVSEGTGENTLYLNQGDGTFSATLLAATPLFESGPLFVDYDGDGFLDIIMGGVSPTDLQLNSVRVYRNLGILGGVSFELDLTATATLTPPSELSTFSISAGDINGDQRLDLFLTHWQTRLTGNAPGEDDVILHGGGFLWSNDGGGAFTDITTQAGLDDLENTFTANFSDIDGDGDLDLLISSDFGSSRVLVNDGGGVFSESTGSVLSDENGMGAAVGDYDGDGDMDWFVSSIFDPNGVAEGGWGVSGNRLYQNDGSGTFTDVTESAGVRMGFWGWGSCFADFDNDGWLDLFHVNGWREEQFLNDPSRLFMSNGDGTFTEASFGNGLVDDGQGRGVVCFDADRDGDIDIFVANNGDGPSLYMNQIKQSTQPFNYLGVVLKGPSPNTQGIGALITIIPLIGGTPSIERTQVREIRAGNNFVSQNPAEAHFGLGDATSVDLSVRWPDGFVSNVSNVAANQLLVLSHPSR